MESNLANLSINEFEINYNKALEKVNMPMYHYHDTFEIYYLLSGERFYFIKDRTYHVMKGDLVFINIGDLHKTTSTPKPAHARLVINFKESFIHPLADCSSTNILDVFKREINLIRLGAMEQNEVEQILHKIHSEYKNSEQFSMLNIKSLLLQLLIFMNRYKNPLTESNIRHPSAIHGKIYEVVQFINQNYSDRLKLENLAKKFYFSPFYLCKMFKQVTGFSFTEYLNSVRIKESQKLLRETSLPISEIACKVGYDNLTHYGRVFKEISGTTPTGYRKNLITQKG
ncbi:MAG TPA: AraC family transcriptional regulator [Clostridiaceae bacterium]|nr:AraC family transcriptional regulator [Clostridiaceae bacterium]